MTPATPLYLSLEQAMAFVGDKDGVRSLLQTLAQSLEQDIPLVQQHIDRGDVPGANRLLHQFKGFAPVFCTPALVQTIVAVEQLSKGQDLAALRQAYAPLAPQLEGLLQEVRQALATS